MAAGVAGAPGSIEPGLVWRVLKPVYDRLNRQNLRCMAWLGADLSAQAVGINTGCEQISSYKSLNTEILNSFLGCVLISA